MANFNQQPNKTNAGTNIQAVKQQNAGAGAGAAAGAFGTEFGAETNAAEVKKLNQQSQANKNAGSGNFGQQ